MAPYTEPLAPSAPGGSAADVRAVESRLMDRLEVEIRALADAVDTLAAALGHTNHIRPGTQEQA